MDFFGTPCTILTGNLLKLINFQFANFYPGGAISQPNKVLVLQRGAQSEEMAEPDPAPTHEPKNSKFKQQALPAWQPILTAGTVLPTFFVIGVAFIPIGVGLMYFSDTVKEVSIEYTDCNVDRDANKMCKDMITNFKVETQWRTCASKIKAQHYFTSNTL